jgi:hypothetical protein
MARTSYHASMLSSVKEQASNGRTKAAGGERTLPGRPWTCGPSSCTWPRAPSCPLRRRATVCTFCPSRGGQTTPSSCARARRTWAESGPRTHGRSAGTWLGEREDKNKDDLEVKDSHLSHGRFPSHRICHINEISDARIDFQTNFSRGCGH